MGMIPGLGGKIKDAELDQGEVQLKRTEAIIHSMTKGERAKPDTINPSRKRRIAAGSGTKVEDVNRLLKQFEQMQKMMKQFGGGKKKMGFPGMGGFSGGFPGSVITSYSIHYTKLYDEAAQKLLELCSFSLSDISRRNLSDLSERTKGIGVVKLADQLSIGVPTLNDIISELQKPGRDPRDELPAPLLRSDVISYNFV